MIHPLGGDPSTAFAVDYDDRDLLTTAPGAVSFVLPDAPIKDKTFWTTLERTSSRSWCAARSRSSPTASSSCSPESARARRLHRPLPGSRGGRRTPRPPSSATSTRRRPRRSTTSSRPRRTVPRCSRPRPPDASRRSCCRPPAACSAASSAAGKRSSSLTTELRGAAGRRSRSRAAGERLDAAQSKAGSISAQLTDLESDLSDDILRITGAWDEKAAAVDSVPVSLERTDVQVAQLVLAWVPVT